MGLIDPGTPKIETLSLDDIPRCLELSAEAGWNQAKDDWRMMLLNGKAFGIRHGGSLIATSVAIPYPPSFGWVSMVLVTATHRRRGHATRLLGHAIDVLKAAGLVPTLDATPAGREVYRPLGFLDLEPITRFRLRAAHEGAASESTAFDIETANQLDRRAFGANRSFVLKALARRAGAFGHSLQSGAFLMSRAGRTATQIGPIVSGNRADALQLLRMALEAIKGPLLIDVPDREVDIGRLLSDNGFEAERPFMRMALGSDVAFGEPGLLRAIAGPELG